MTKPQDHPCIAQDCVLEGRNQVGLRVRVAHDGESPYPHKRRTDAIYSIESDACLCDRHAPRGGTFSLFFEPDDTEEIARTGRRVAPPDMRGRGPQPLDDAGERA